MSTKIASLYAEIGAKTDGLEKGLSDAKVSLSQFAMAIAGGLVTGQAAFDLLTSAVTKTVDVLKESVDAAAEAEAVDTRLSAALRATGRGAEVSSAQLDKTAKSLARISAFDDESIKSAYVALMQFDNIPTDKMQDITKAAMDLSAAMGGDIASNAEQIGRILETGVVPRSMAFSASLREQVKAEVEAGNSGKALSLVLGELNSRYGGQAVAQMETYAGKVQRLKNDWQDLEEIIGQAPVAGGKGAVDLLDDIILKYQVLGKAMNDVGSQQKTFWDHLPIIGQFRQLAALLPAIQSGFGDAGDAITDEGNAAEIARAQNWALQSGMQKLATETKTIATDYKELISSIQGMQGVVNDWKDAQKNKSKADEQADRDLRAGLITVDEYNAKIAENEQNLLDAKAASEQWAKQTVFGFLQAKAAADGVITDAEGEVMIAVGEQMGLFDKGTAEAMRNANKAFDNLDTSNAQESIAAVRLALIDLTTRDWTVTLGIMNNTGLGGIPSAPPSGGEDTIGNKKYAAGGSFIIPQSYGYEGFNMGGMASASGGEEVTITPKGQAKGVTNNYYITGQLIDRAFMRWLAQETTRMQTG